MKKISSSILVELESGDVGFCGGRKTGEPGEKKPWCKAITNIKVQSKAFSGVGVKIWNGIPTSLKNLSKNSFKKFVPTKLTEILEPENSYAEMGTIINKMKD